MSKSVDYRLVKHGTKRVRQTTDALIPNNLPRYLTKFVGRGPELSALKAELPRSRMVTLTGAGGSGKTRLAAELGQATLEHWPGGVWWVELAHISDPRQVAGALASTLELPGLGPALEVVIAWLAAKRALVVLDNCEHLVAAAAEFCEAALRGCPKLTVMATSREALGVSGEARWQISSLPAAEAVQLFEARARLLHPDFKVVATNFESVSNICERLDRLPLAIEMAAARLDMMTESELLANLTDRFRLLTSGTRSAPERHQTLIGAIDWSYRLLTEEEALLFRRMSVFRSGFTLESAQAICANDEKSVLNTLARLVQKSMVDVDRSAGSGSRYRMLESVRTYGEEQLQAVGETQAILRRHHEYFARALTGPWPSRPLFADFSARQAWKRRESDNLKTALLWAREYAEDKGLGLAFEVASLGSGDLVQAQSLLLDLIEQSPATGAVRMAALIVASWNALNMGDYETALTMADRALALARQIGDVEHLVRALNRAGHVHQDLGDFVQADVLFSEATSLLAGSQNIGLINVIRNSVGMLAVTRGDYAAARSVLTELVVDSRSDEDVDIASYVESLARAQFGLKEYRLAGISWKECLANSRDLHDHLNILLSLAGLCRVAEACHDDIRAIRLGAAANRLSGELSLKFDLWPEPLDEVLGRARTRLPRRGDEGWNAGWAMNLDRAIDYALGEREPEAGFDAGPLSRREAEVAQHVAAGMTNRDIAAKLFLSERTVEGHVDRIRGKLGFRSRAEIGAWLAANGLTAAAP